MKPRSKRESYWRLEGAEYRHIYKQSPGAAKTARNFTRKQCNKAMRAFGKHQIHEGLDETQLGSTQDLRPKLQIRK